MCYNIKSNYEIAKIRTACILATEVLEMIEQYIFPGVATIEINNICHDYITRVQKAFPGPLNYLGFPRSICTSVNNVVCHGIPGNEKLENGDIVNIDITVVKDGYFGDTSKMFIVGKTNDLAENIVKVAQECLYLGIKEVKPGSCLGNIGAAIQYHAESHNFSVVREYCGHGIGAAFHEPPQILHYGERNTGEVLKKGMVFTIEPMINVGTCLTRVLNDGWTVITEDAKLSAQFEHTVLVTENGHEILTKRSEEIVCNR